MEADYWKKGFTKENKADTNSYLNPNFNNESTFQAAFLLYLSD